MNPKFVIYRRDIVSYISLPIDTLLCFKIVKNKLVFDEKRKLPGRSFYIKKDVNSLKEFVTSKKFLKYQNLINTKEIITSLIEKLS